jgi:hypothetical protein
VGTAQPAQGVVDRGTHLLLDRELHDCDGDQGQAMKCAGQPACELARLGDHHVRAPCRARVEQ